MSEIKQRKKKVICIECLNVNYYEQEKCSDCGNILVLNHRTALIDECGNTVFYAYQNRKAIEHFIENAPPGIPHPKLLQMGLDEIFSFIAGAIIGGITWDVTKSVLVGTTKFFIIKIKTSLERKGIRLKGIKLKSGLTSGEELLKKLAEDDKELEKFIRYVIEYRNGMQGVHPGILSETRPLNLKVIEENKDILLLLLESIDEKKNDASES